MESGVATSYLFLQAAVLTLIYLFTFDTWRARFVTSRRFWVRTAMLVAIWVVADRAAIALGIWRFRVGATLPIHLFGLPFEEYAMFVTHAVGCQMLMANFQRAEVRP
jgi:lycopene cyclase domain-containing protein